MLYKKMAFYAFVLILLIFSLFPFYWAIVSSLKTSGALFEVQYFNFHPTLENYKSILAEQNFLTSVSNSVIVAFLTVLISLLVSILASYALGRIDFRGRKLLLYTILGVSMFPQIAVLSGMFEILRYFKLYNSLLGLVFSYLMLVLPFTIWVLTTFMRELPKELEEAAILDGCGPLRIVFQIFLPLLKPALVTTGLLAFIAAWNEFLFSLTFTLTANKRTVPVAISSLSGASQFELPWGVIMAASVLVTVPLIVLVLIFQKQIIAGLTAGAVKG